VILILIGLFFLLMFLGLPIAFSLGLSSLMYIIVRGYPLEIMVQRMFSMTQSFPLLAIPFFILLGQLAGYGGMAKRILKFSQVLVGHLRGSLGLVSVVASMVFAGMSGSAVADAAGIGSILIPAMKKAGYDDGFNTAINATSSTLSVIIPPSIPMVVLGWVTSVSVGSLFLGGAIPGLVITASMFLYTLYIAKKRNYPVSSTKPTLREILSTAKEVIWALIVPVVIILSILTGVATPTEVAVLAVVYTLLVSIFVYKELTWQGFVSSIRSTAISTVVVMAVVTSSGLFSWLLAYERLPQALSQAILSVSSNPTVVLLIINAMLLIAGMFIDLVPNILLFAPILFPLAGQLGIDPVHFGVMMVVNLAIGLYTPPVGTTLFVSCNLAEVPIERVARDLVPFTVMGVAVLLLIVFVPGVVTWLPRMVFR
jgi:tripartite ATP-independent transporter DctM subunit